MHASSLERRISRFFNDALTGFDWQYRDSAAAAWVPPVDIFEEAERFTLPATVDAGHIRAQYENGVSTVTLPKLEKAKPR